jgi:hypothetical protein
LGGRRSGCTRGRCVGSLTNGTTNERAVCIRGHVSQSRWSVARHGTRLLPTSGGGSVFWGRPPPHVAGTPPQKEVIRLGHSHSPVSDPARSRRRALANAWFRRTCLCRALVTTCALFKYKPRPAKCLTQGRPCQLCRSARPQSSVNSRKLRPSWSARPWSSPMERPGRSKMSGSTNYTACEFRSEVTLEGGQFPPSSSCRRAKPKTGASEVRLVADETANANSNDQVEAAQEVEAVEAKGH